MRHCCDSAIVSPSVSNDSVTAVNYERRIVALMSNKGKKQHRQNSKILNSKNIIVARYRECDIFSFLSKGKKRKIPVFPFP